MNKPNLLWLCLMTNSEARSALEEYERRRLGVTVFCGPTLKPAGMAPWAVGSGPISIDGILHEYSRQYEQIAGGWWDEEQQQYLWEAVTLFASKIDALLAAELRGEKCIYNIVTGEEVWLDTWGGFVA